MQLRHTVCTVKTVITVHEGKKRRACIEPAPKRCCCSLLPTAADALLDPSNLVNHEAQAVMCSAMPARDAILDRAGILLQLRQDEYFYLEIHICRRCDGCSWDLVERVFGIGRVVLRSNPWIEHTDINSIIPLSSDPARMYRSCDRIRVVAIDTRSP
jgi:hypothetical protein